MKVLYSFYLFILGAVLGSFYRVVSDRLPKGESLIKPGSHCEYCDHHLKWYELIPIVSYVIQGGKCRNCQKKLPISYIITELFSGLLFVVSYLKFDFSPQFFISCLLSSLVILIFVSDMKYMIILDSPMVIAGVAIFFIKWIDQGYIAAFSSLLAGFLSFLTVFIIGKLGNIAFKKESLGGGDIKLSFLMGLTLGYKMAMLSFVFSTFLALPYAIVSLFLKEGHVVPFGPFLVSSLWIIYFFFEKFELIWNYFFYI